jgi:hypothetical protein
VINCPTVKNSSFLISPATINEKIILAKVEKMELFLLQPSLTYEKVLFLLDATHNHGSGLIFQFFV